MHCGIKQRLDSLIDHYSAACIVLALFILSLVGVGNVVIVSLLGLLLCMVGLTQRSCQADLWILIPFLVYDLVCLASSYAAHGDIVGGYGVFHALYPLLYLLFSCMEEGDRRLVKKCCALWAGVVAVIGIGQFTVPAVAQGRAWRLSSLLGNPNAAGIFLVLGWFAAMNLAEEEGQDRTALSALLEPLILTALALTLSMGSFAAMAAGILVLAVEKRRTSDWRETFRYACRILARASLGVGMGLLIYLGAARTDAPWICLPLLVYGAVLAASWQSVERFLEAKPKMAARIAFLGTLVAAATVILRPSAADTFSERLEMMRSGLHYLTTNPLLGVGPFCWRLLDLNDGGKYFNTWHIHNVFLHVGVEMGWIAMGMLLLIGVRILGKRKTPPERALAAAFLFHNMIDTSFFYLGITALALTAAGDPRQSAHEVNSKAAKVLFALFAGLFVYSLCVTVMST